MARGEKGIGEVVLTIEHGLARTQEQVDDCLSKCGRQWRPSGRTSPVFLTYQQGVRAALEWVTGRTPHHPLGDTDA
jgi:hypothetical protein